MKPYLLVSIVIINFFSNLAISEVSEFKIGVTAPLSGDLAAVGQEILKGLELASKDKSNNQISFTVIAEDDQFLGRNAAGNAKKLISLNKVNALISLWDMAEIVAPIAEEKKIPHFAIRWNPHVAEKYSYTMTIESTYISYLNSIIKLLEHENIRTISLITEETEGWLIGNKKFKELLQKANFQLVHEAFYIRGSLDQSTLVKKALTKKPDMFILFSNPPNVEILIKKIKELNPQQKFTGYFEILDNPEIAENMPFVAQLQPAEWFVRKYENAYHQQIKSRAPQSYDILTLLNDAIRDKNHIPEGRDIVEHISQIKNFPGASGQLNARGTRTIEMDCVWKISRDGKFTLYSNLK